METLAYFIQRFGIDLSKPSPFYIPCGRFEEIPEIFKELGFKKGAEVGVYRAKYSEFLFKGIPNLDLTGIDLWESYPGYKDFQKNDLADAYLEAKSVFDRYQGTLIRGWSADVVKTIPDKSLDFVFIDGNHAYEYTVQDIALWSKKVRPGGVIYGHDYDDYTNSRRWAEMNVVNAVNGWCASYKIHPWFVLKNNRNKSWLYVA